MEDIESKNFTCELQLFYLPVSNFKEKQSNILMNSISNGRLGQEIKFNSFANISFEAEDKQLRYPTFKPLDGFARSKTNCLVYDVLETEKNPGMWDKCYIFMQGGHDVSYSFIMYNTKTGRMVHKFMIPLEYDSIVIAIQGVLDSIPRVLHIEKYAARLESPEKYQEYKKYMEEKEAKRETNIHPIDKFNNRRY